MRCEACGQQWRAYREGAPPSRPLPSIPSSEVQPSEVPAPEVQLREEPGPKLAPEAGPALFRAPAPARRVSARQGTSGIAWAVAVMIALAMGLAAVVVFRDQIVRADPALASIYSRLGLVVPQPGHGGPRG